MDDAALARAILKQRQQFQSHASTAEARVVSGLSPLQSAFVLDESKRQLAITGRQAGKTEGCCRKLVRRAISKAGAKCLYIGTTRENAYDVMWQRLQDMLTTLGVDYEANGSRLEIRLIRNNSTIRLTGVNHKVLADRIRGNEFDEVVIDEAAVYGNALLSYMINDVIDQTLLIRRGVLSLVSTPGLLQSGWFWELCNGKGQWSRHKWTMRDNPALGDIDAYMERKLAENGWTRDEPVFRREYLGEWCQDTKSGVYRVGPDNLIGELPPGPFHSILGVDLGYNDEAAFCVLGWRDADPNLYQLHASGAPELTVTDIAERIRELKDRYQPTEIICDAGALGKTIVAELTVRHGLNITAADKRDKPSAIRLVNSDFAKKSLWLLNDRLYEQMSNLRWHPDYIGLKEQDGIPNDLCDAMLYAFRRCWHYVQRIRQPEPEFNSDEWLNMQAEQNKQHLRDQMRGDPYKPLNWENEYDF